MSVQPAEAEALAAGLPRLLLAAERLAHAVAPGAHGRRRTGAGENFWQFREFRNGDDSRRIDWRRSASADRLFLREREWQAQATIQLSLRAHPGMDFRSAASLPTKRERATLLLLATASLLLRSGERVALAGATPPLGGSAALDEIAAALLRGSQAPINPQINPSVDFRARVVAFGDFLEPDPVFRHVSGGAVMQILDPAECDFPYRGRILFEGFSGEPPVESAKAEGWAAAYRARIAAQRQAVAGAATRAGQTALFHRTDAAPAAALAALYQALAQP